jgi:hypothetical protein
VPWQPSCPNMDKTLVFYRTKSPTLVLLSLAIHLPLTQRYSFIQLLSHLPFFNTGSIHFLSRFSWVEYCLITSVTLLAQDAASSDILGIHAVERHCACKISSSAIPRVVQESQNDPATLSIPLATTAASQKNLYSSCLSHSCIAY